MRSRTWVPIAAALCLVITLTGATAAAASATTPAPCLATDVVFAVDPHGALVEHDYCLTGNRILPRPPHRLTAPGWRLSGAIFSGRRTGTVTDPLALYQVDSRGALFWYRTAGPGGRIMGGARVGAALGDWRRYRSLFSPGGGWIYGLDAHGRLLRWRHAGWASGADQWTGPEVAGTGLGEVGNLAGRSVGNRPSYSVGFAAGDPHTLRFWGPGGREVRAGQPVTGAPVAGPVTFGRSVHGYGRAADGRLVRLARVPGGSAGQVRWLATELTTAQYAEVFDGDRLEPDTGMPYEWQ
jgi:hypothetical protein